jgi:hypothetical protein
MKNLLVILVFIGFNPATYSQFYNRTDKNWGLYVSAAPFNTVYLKGQTLNANSYQFSTGLMKLVYTGIYPKIGYGYTHFKDNSKYLTSGNGIHSINAGVLIQMNIFDFGQKKIGSTCHAMKCGLIITPEYRYAFSNKALKNYASGEFAGEFGLSFRHVSSSPRKKNRSRTRHYDLYYRNGFTSFYETNGFAGNDKYMSKEIGFRVRFVFHKVYDFLK